LVYSVIYANSVAEDLLKLDKPLRKKIVDKIERYLVQDPQGLGKPLTGAFKGFWRYRFDDYRIVYRISTKEILITVLRVAHRKNVYSKAIDN
jgi:mRNA interferase RelE/StbE